MRHGLRNVIIVAMRRIQTIHVQTSPPEAVFDQRLGPHEQRRDDAAIDFVFHHVGKLPIAVSVNIEATKQTASAKPNAAVCNFGSNLEEGLVASGKNAVGRLHLCCLSDEQRHLQLLADVLASIAFLLQIRLPVFDKAKDAIDAVFVSNDCAQRAFMPSAKQNNIGGRLFCGHMIRI